MLGSAACFDAFFASLARDADALDSFGIQRLQVLRHTSHSPYRNVRSVVDPLNAFRRWKTNAWQDFQSSDSKVKLSAIKKFALVCGSLGQILLVSSSLFASTLVASITHFYTIELDYKLSLKVRPYAYVLVSSLLLLLP